MPLPVFTLGHSTRSLEDFLALLNERDIELLVDVRRSEEHVFNSSARVLPDGRLIYDGGAGQQAELFD